MTKYVTEISKQPLQQQYVTHRLKTCRMSFLAFVFNHTLHCQSFTPKCYRQLQVKDLPKVLRGSQSGIRIYDPADARCRTYHWATMPHNLVAIYAWFWLDRSHRLPCRTFNKCQQPKTNIIESKLSYQCHNGTFCCQLGWVKEISNEPIDRFVLWIATVVIVRNWLFLKKEWKEQKLIKTNNHQQPFISAVNNFSSDILKGLNSKLSE